MRSGVELESATFRFSQQGNCVDKAEYETLTVEYKSDLGLDYTNGGFFVIKTEQWSVDSVEELQKLFDRISKAMIKE